MPIYHAIYNVVDGQDTIDANKWNAPHTIVSPVTFSAELHDVHHIYPEETGIYDIGHPVTKFRHGFYFGGVFADYFVSDTEEFRGIGSGSLGFESKDLQLNYDSPGDIDEDANLRIFARRASPATKWAVNMHLDGPTGNFYMDIPRNLIVPLPDNLGQFEFQVRDSDDVTVYRVDSDGNIDFAGAIQRSIAEFQNQPVTSLRYSGGVWQQIATITLSLDYPKTLMCLAGTEIDVEETGLYMMRINVDGDAGYSGRSMHRELPSDKRGFLQSHLVKLLSVGPHTIYFEVRGEHGFTIWTGELSAILL